MRWPDWLILITSGALVWGAVSSFRSSGIILSQAGADGTYHDTYYVIAYSQNLIFPFAGFALIAFFYVALIRPAGLKLAAIAALSIAVAALDYMMVISPQSFAGPAAMPRRYVDYPEAMAVLSAISKTGAAAFVLAAVVLLTVTGLAVIRRLRR